ncbi:MAG: hypothetical protein JWR03_101 [Cohnella sp.]|nr:hypothetical protein [Cohnella sp.]
MRKALVTSSLLLSALLAISGCVDNHTGDVGHKNIRPYYKNDYDQNRNRVNGVHSYTGPTRTRFADDGAMKMHRRNGELVVENYVTTLHGNHHLEWSDRIASHLATLPEVNSAYVMVTDRNAYVAVIDNNKDGVVARSADQSAALHDKIADHVRSMSPTVQNVYVSSNPDFVGRMKIYAVAVGQGRPVQGFLTEFNALTQRIFPSLTPSPDSVGSGDTAGMGAGAAGNYGTYGTQRSYGPSGTPGFGRASR